MNTTRNIFRTLNYTVITDVPEAGKAFFIDESWLEHFHLDHYYIQVVANLCGRKIVNGHTEYTFNARIVCYHGQYMILAQVRSQSGLLNASRRLLNNLDITPVQAIEKVFNSLL